MKTLNKNEIVFVPMEKVISKILLVKGKKVMLDKDLADLYQVKAIALRQAVKRNIKRFPPDFMFQLNKKEATSMVSQNVIPSMQYFGGSLPYVFTEQGVAMLSSILNSERAILVNIQIIRTFTKLRELLATNVKLRKKIEAIEQKYDTKFKKVFDILKQLLMQGVKTKSQIGFRIK
ncbi:MAG: ORF6N domain-containing protein [Candidatus Paceibacterota bacterium]